jgi:prephenate dehydrogenase
MIPKNIVIIGGAGKMGSLFANLLKDYYDVGIFDKNYKKSVEISKKLNIKVYTELRESINENNVIILSTPIFETKRILYLIALQKECKNKLIFDICSYKSHLIPIYKKFNSSNMLASIHPLFGSGIKDTKGQRILVIPIPNHEKDIIYLKKIFEPFEFDFIELEASLHDELISNFVGLTYLNTLIFMKKIKTFRNYFKFGGTSFKLMLLLSNLILNDSEEQIVSICQYEISKKALRQFIKVCDQFIKLDKKSMFKEIHELKNEYADEELYWKIYELLSKLF